MKIKLKYTKRQENSKFFKLAELGTRLLFTPKCRATSSTKSAWLRTAGRGVLESGYPHSDRASEEQNTAKEFDMLSIFAKGLNLLYDYDDETIRV